MQIGEVVRNYPGESVCGDTTVVIQLDQMVTVAVADGLGHGPEAALASKAFCSFVKKNHKKGLEQLMQGAHRALRSTRGVAASILRFDQSTDRLEFVGIGNIEVRTFSKNSVGPVSLPGVVGQQMRKCVVFEYEICAGDLFAIFSDGISSHFGLKKYRNLEAQETANAILVDHSKGTDDASCVVVRYDK